MILIRPNDRVAMALKRLRNDVDFQEVKSWIEHSLVELDRLNRATIDPVMVRMNQGAAQVLSEIVARADAREPLKAIPTASIPAPIRDGLG